MDGVAEGIEDSRHFLIDLRVMPPDVGHRQRNQLSKTTRPVHADAQRLRAEMPSPRQAVPAAAANHVALPADDVPATEIIYVRADFDDLTNEFMSNDHRYRDCLPGPVIPLEDMHVGAADTCVSNADQHVVDADGGFWNFFQP